MVNGQSKWYLYRYPRDLALSGHLSNFFARKGIVFDKDTGLFRIDNQFSRQIRLVGHGQKYAMVRKSAPAKRNFGESGSGIEYLD